MEVDHIVVGAGAAGCVLAARLARVPGSRVLLVEAGGGDRDPRLHAPLAFARAMRRPALTWRYPTEPLLAGGAGETWVRGRVLGGSTAINGMMYARGTAADWDALAEVTDHRWGWPHALAAYRAMEDHQLGSGPGRGTGGPLPVTIDEPHGPVTVGVLAAAAALGIPHVPDVNEADDERIGATPSTVRRGRRVSAARAFLPGAGGQLTIVDRSQVGHLLFDGGRVVGVRTRRRGTIVDHHARGEVVLAAGAIGSPTLLERSGIGRGEVLTAAGVPVRLEHPQVGEGLVEQRAVTVKARLTRGLGRNPQLRTPARRAAATARYALTRTGPVAAIPYELSAAVRSRPEVDRPDAQLLVTTLCPDETGLEVAPHDGLMVQGYPLRPTTRGGVHIAGPTLERPPRIEARYLDTDADQRTTVAVLERIRALLAEPAVRGLVREEVTPGPEVTSRAAVIVDTLRRGAGIYHAVGSCAAGGDGAVVDADLRVRGVPGLRVVDASVFPTHPSAGTAAPTMALAWLAAERIIATSQR